MSDELKCCPFCGGKAQRVEDLIRRYREFPFYVQCAGCRAKTDRYPEMKDAVEAWNRRTTMWRHEIIEKLRKNLAELPSDMIEYNLGYAAAISDLEHIAEDKES